MTPQELFDTVVGNLRKQGGKALLDQEQLKTLIAAEGTCAYRAKDGKKCAAGGLLTDQEYKPAMEGNNLFVVMELSPSFKERVGDDCSLLRDLQDVHDRFTVVNWERGFRDIAQAHGLIYAPPSAS